MIHRWLRLPAASATLVVFSLAGCQPGGDVANGKNLPESKAQVVDPSIEKNLQSLPEADRAEAVAQKRCPVSGEPLGSMGAPIKVPVRNTSVFLCCEGCRKKLMGNPDAYLGAR